MSKTDDAKLCQNCKNSTFLNYDYDTNVKKFHCNAYNKPITYEVFTVNADVFTYSGDNLDFCTKFERNAGSRVMSGAGKLFSGIGKFLKD